MLSATAPAPVSLLDVLREREAQAHRHGASYLAPVADTDSMLFWLARAASAAREAAGRKQVHVAASADLDQSSIARFEKGISWPRQPDTIVGAYAEDLDVSPIQLWEQALQLWREHLDTGATPAGVADLVEAESQQQRERQARSAPSRHKSRR